MSIPQVLQTLLDAAKLQTPVYVPALIRDQFEQMIDTFALPKLHVPLIQNHTLNLVTHQLALRIYHPEPALKLPLILYFHGGGHMCGSLDSYDNLCRRLAMTSRCVVLSVAYRLAPEFPYPAGLEDCLNVLLRRVDLLNTIQVNHQQLFLAGDSAGGNLVLSVAQRMAEQEENIIKGLVLIYPSVDYSMNHDSFQRNGADYLLTRERVKWYFDHYFSQGGDRVAASPLYFAQLELLPPMYLAVAEYDPLFDENILFSRKVAALGVPITIEVFAGMVHVFAQLETVVPLEVLRLHRSIHHFIKNLTA